jgi:CHAT domain-containing protein
MAQKKGAKAVLATLWSVADESTRAFMVEFYRLYQKPDITKAEALQQAQTAMIEGRLKPTVKGEKKRAELVGGVQGASGKSFVFNKAKPFAHPYYWSPFVLIGNWR